MGRVVESYHLIQSRPFLLVNCALSLCLVLVPLISHAAQISTESDLEQSLIQSKSIVNAIKVKLNQSSPVSVEITQLKSVVDNIRISNLLLEERFNLREAKIKTLGSKATTRHQTMVKEYRKALLEYLDLMDGLIPTEGRQPATSDQLSAIEKLNSLFDKFHPKKKRPLLGSLPYKHLNYPAQEPSTVDTITPAYKGGNKTVSPNDTAATPEAPMSKEIATLAQSLNWQPVAIYEYVKNNIETEWYWGCQKGAGETLRQKSGNDCDQATLLTALLRASGFPTRYVRGTIEFFASDDRPIERVKNLTGIDNPAKIAEFFQKSGIPYKPIIAGGVISNFQIEHIYVESYIPMSNYRGVVLDEHGKTWIGLDTSIKVKDYVYNAPKDLFELPEFSGQLSVIRDEYLGAVQTQTPLEYLQSRINSELLTQNSQLAYTDFLRTKVLTPEHMSILPGSMQFTLVKVTSEYTRIPDELMHKVKFSAVSNQQSANTDKLFEITLPLYKLSNQQIAITYEPETVQDQEIIDSYGGLDNTPAYLVNLRPMLKVNNERIVVAQGGVSMGGEFNLVIDLISPNGTQSITNSHIVGNLSVIGITAQKAVLTPSPLAGEGGGEGAKDAARLQYEEAMNYNDRWNKAEDELASLLHLALTRPLPTIVTIGGVIDVAYLMDMPHGFTWKGLFIDAGLKRIEAVTKIQSTDDRVQAFMKLSSLQGSILENRVFEDDFQVQSMSTAKLMTVANDSQAAIITIDKTNIDSVLPTLPFDQNIKDDIANAVNQNQTIRIPQSETTYQDWTGIGYIKENLVTGESGWMLSGMIAGGMTSIKKQDWINKDLADTLNAPISSPPNTNPGEAVKLVRLKASDYQDGTVDTVLPTQLMIQAQDRSGRPVKGVEVTYTIIAGGGSLQQTNVPLANQDTKTMTTITGQDGMAGLWLRLGKETSVSPYYLFGSPNLIQVGLNLIAVTARAYTGDITSDKPFETYGLPGPAERIEKAYGDSTDTKKVFSNPNTFSGTIVAKVVDHFGNLRSNETVTFSIGPQTYLGTPPTGDVQNAKLYRNSGDCPGIPTLDCQMASASVGNIVTDTSGAFAYVILGNTDNTRFNINAETKTIGSDGKQVVLRATFTHYSYTIPRFNGFTDPFLSIAFMNHVDEKGNRIDAGKPGKTLAAPLTTKLLYTEEDMIIADSGNGTCALTGGNGTFRTVPVTNSAPGNPEVYDGKVVFEATNNSGSPIGTLTPATQVTDANGLYTSSLTLDPLPTKYALRAIGTAKAQLPRSCSGGKIVREESTLWQSVNGTVSATTIAWGVRAVIDPLNLIMVNESGYPTADTSISYRIEPTDYQPQARQLFIYEKDANGIETWIGVMAPDKDGKFVLSRGGAKFETAKRYFVTLVLNLGSSIEITSEKVELPVTAILVKDDTSDLSKEIKIGRGDKKWPEKIYHIETPGNINANNCSGHSGKVSIVNKDGQLITAPTIERESYAVEYPLTFYKPWLPLLNSKCNIGVADTLDNGSTKDKFIVSNRPRTVLDVGGLDAKAVLYAGIGNRMRIEFDGLQQEIPIEPVGVVILGIDGLRQDVLYKPLEQQVYPVGVLSPYYVPSTELTGLCEVLGGKYNGAGSIMKCDDTEMPLKSIRLQNVTTIFPSITFAAWASIFTGMMPSGTGITGNEFFAWDLYNASVPINVMVSGMNTLPSGMVTLDADGGAMRAKPTGGLVSSLLGWKNESAPFALNYVMPAEFLGYNTVSEKLATSAPGDVLMTIPLWKDVNDVVTAKYQVDASARCDQSTGECRTVSMFNQYAAGVDWWGTPSVKWKTLWDTTWDGSLFDAASTTESVDFINNYFKQPTKSGKRKRFPALFSVYLPGLDHDAHLNGMGHYKTFVQDTVDVKVNQIANALKGQDEFDNKMFIIVSDHGHTAMPTELTYIHEQPIYDPESGDFKEIKQTNRHAEMSCVLKTNFAVNSNNDYAGKNAKNAELENNNLHIWELGEILKTVGKMGWGQYKVLAPKEIAELYLIKDKATNKVIELPNGATAIAENADVIVGLNGPMAHVYLADIIKLGKIAELLRLTLDEHPEEAARWWNVDALDYSDFKVNTIGRLKASVDKILVRISGNYCVFDELNDDGSAKCAVDDPFSVTAYIDAWTRINGMNHKDRSGDIVLIMKDTTTGDAIDRYTTAYACKSWHGSLNPSDSYVPLIVSYPGGNKKEMENILKKDAVCNADYGNCKNNWKLPSMVKGLISEQYK